MGNLFEIVASWRKTAWNLWRLLLIIIDSSLFLGVILLLFVPILGCAPILLNWINKGLADNTIKLITTPFTNENLRLFLVPLLFLISHRIVVFMLGMLRSHLRFKLGNKIQVTMQDRLIDKQLSFPMEVYESPHLLDKISRSQKNSINKPAQALDSMLGVIQSIITLAGSFIFLASLSIYLPISSILSSVIRLIVDTRFSQKRYGLLKSRTERVRREGYVRQLISGKTSLIQSLLFGLNPFFRDQYTKYRDISIDEDVRLHKGRCSCLTFVYLLTSGVFFLSYAYIVYLTMKTSGSYGSLIMFVGLYRQTETSFKMIGNHLASFHEQKLFMEDFFDIESSPITRVVPSLAQKIPSKIESIVFENVSFCYPSSSNYILRNVSFTLNMGEISCLVGANGAGKTTILMLLTRMYKPTEGQILINGININNFEEESFYQSVGFLTQKIPYYYYTIKENVLLGDYWNAKDKYDLYQKTCLEYGIDEIANKFREKHDAKLGRIFSNGYELSYGQWKKLALARVAFKNAPIQLLDEPIAGIDPIYEKEIVDLIYNRKYQHISIIVSHKMSLVKQADKIILLENGKIREQGTHKELMDLGGRYQLLLASQLQDGELLSSECS